MIQPAAESPGPTSIDRRILTLHMLGAGCLGTAISLVFVLPFLARQRFGASDWHTPLLTAAVPVMQLFTILWNHVYARLPVRRYLLLLALLAALPIALIALTDRLSIIIVCFILAAFGGAGGGAALSPLNADLLRTCYAAGVRGRAFGLVSTSQMFATLTAGLAIGYWSDRDPDAYRWFMPMLACLVATGLTSYALISRIDVFESRSRIAIAGPGPWHAPFRDMVDILRADRRFFRYEVAFMLYGAGWMICTALLPIIGTDRLHLSNTGYASGTVVAFQLSLVLLLGVMGRVADRIGPMRLASLSFLWLTLYPLGLLVCSDLAGLFVITVLYALGMAGVHLSWTLGPVSLAGDPARSPHYLAIHGTLVGVRAILFQGLGIALYRWTGGFVVPLLLGAVGFVLAAWEMRRVRKSSGPSVAGQHGDDVAAAGVQRGHEPGNEAQQRGEPGAGGDHAPRDREARLEA